MMGVAGGLVAMHSSLGFVDESRHGWEVLSVVIISMVE